jgi:hypothetical protein
MAYDGQDTMGLWGPVQLDQFWHAAVGRHAQVQRPEKIMVQRPMGTVLELKLSDPHGVEEKSGQICGCDGTTKMLLPESKLDMFSYMYSR